MARSNKARLCEAEVVAWAIPRIAGGHHAMSDDENGRELWVTEHDPEIGDMVGELLHARDERVKQAFQRLRENCCFTNVRTLLILLLGEKLGETLAQQFAETDLTPLHYGLVVTRAYNQEERLLADLK
jgi:hypothetical protein